MTIILNGRTPAFPEDDEAAFGSVNVMFHLVERSNHATALSGWIIASGTMALVVEIGTIQAASRAPFGVLLIVGLLPVLASTAITLTLLVRAHFLTAAAHEDFYRFIAETTRHAPELRAPAVRQLQLLTAATRHREMLTHQALNWAYASGIAVLVWSAAATAMASGH